MKVLVIESGSTKADWVMIDTQTSQWLKSSFPGWNLQLPLDRSTRSDEQLSLLSQADKVYFYGAGVNSSDAVETIQTMVGRDKTLIAKSDLDAACIGSLGDKKGIVGIIGTGSISCYWDGDKTEIMIPSLGFIMSDEGGGVDLGKEILKAYFYKEMPAETQIMMEAHFETDRKAILNNIYKSSAPNRFIAEYSKLLTIANDEWSKKLVRDRLILYIQKRILPIFNKKPVEIAFVGSIAFVFNEILLEICHEYGLTVKMTLKSPIEGLIKYHLEKELDTK
jgi:N-acetylglucosamine kinase-like BadF-type ATPase